jgi:glyoxylase-like metal-dependent hydrolase (beta-lactamase superfamily II)
MIPMRMIARFSMFMLSAAFTFAQTPAATPKYQIYAIRYATIRDFLVAGLVPGADPARKLDIAMMVWLVKGEGHNVLVDAGFYRDQFFKQWKTIKDFQKPSDALARVGLKPEDITDVIISHMHWDHADGMDLFPKAKIWIQKDEYSYYTGDAWHAKKTHGGIDPDDVLAIVKLNMDGRVQIVNGDQEIMPGVACYIGGKHTYQSQYVSVSTAKGTVVLASDNMYLYENLDKHVPIAATLDPESNLRAQDRMKQIASDPRLIIPGHDPAVFAKFPAAGDRVAKIE